MHDINMIIKSESTINENSYQGISELPVINKDKKHQCSNCEAGFTRKNSLNRSILFLHEGIKPLKQFKCSECDSSFEGKSVMKRHIDSNHSKKPFKCSKYDSIFKLRKGLNCHKISVHEEKEPMKLCCHRSFIIFFFFQVHIK